MPMASISGFVPAFIGGIFWKRATKTGALASMVVGTAVFCFTNWGMDRQLLQGIHPGVCGLVFGTLSFFAGSYAKEISAKEKERAEALRTERRGKDSALAYGGTGLKKDGFSIRGHHGKVFQRFHIGNNGCPQPVQLSFFPNHP